MFGRGSSLQGIRRFGPHRAQAQLAEVFSAGVGQPRVDQVGVHALVRLAAELHAFGARVWTRKFAAAGLRVEQTVGMPFYFGYRNRFVPLMKAGNALRLPGTWLYVVRKA